MPRRLSCLSLGLFWEHAGREVASSQQEQLGRLASSKGTKVIRKLGGKHFDWDSVQSDFRWPQIVPEEVAPVAKNDDSLVFRVSFGERSFLLSGDAEKLSARPLLRQFLAAVQPRLAVISSGAENPYGHPAPQLLERLAQAGIPAMRTDTNGAVHILTDGKKVEMSCFVACPEIAAQLNSRRPQPPPDQQGN